jgi:hypothetical protein
MDSLSKLNSSFYLYPGLLGSVKAKLIIFDESYSIKDN